MGRTRLLLANVFKLLLAGDELVRSIEGRIKMLVWFSQVEGIDNRVFTPNSSRLRLWKSVL